MHITFLGAAGTVTGSKYLLDIHDSRFLIDCGLFQGLKTLRLQNWATLPINPSSVNAILLTHAHIDHSGYLPAFIKQGFRGPIFCTPATYDLAKILLPDSGYLQEEDAKHANKFHYSKHHPALPLYTQQDAMLALKQFQVVDFHQTLNLSSNCQASWFHAGHILGAASILIRHEHKTIYFSGDLGRFRDPILKPPDDPPICDYLVMESTYGNRLHATENLLDVLQQTILETVKQQGTILIPAFAVGRSQMIIYYLDQLMSQHKIPELPIYLDSPMAINVTKILHQYPKEHRLNFQDSVNMCKRVHYVQSADESKLLDRDNGSKIIIAASGMMSGGRILHHLKYFGPKPETTLLVTGYQAEGTRGAHLLKSKPLLKIYGQMISIKAKIIELSSLSAHSDYGELLLWLHKLQALPKKIFITHGEPHASLAMQRHIQEEFGIKATIPRHLQEYFL